jgi:hypothetical protein
MPYVRWDRRIGGYKIVEKGDLGISNKKEGKSKIMEREKEFKKVKEVLKKNIIPPKE